MPFRSKDSFDFSSSFHRSTLLGALMTWKILTLLNYVIFIIIGKWVLLNEIYWLWNLSQLFVFSWFLMKSLSRLLIECQQLLVLYRARWEIAICKKHQDFRNSHRFLKVFFLFLRLRNSSPAGRRNNCRHSSYLHRNETKRVQFGNRSEDEQRDRKKIKRKEKKRRVPSVASSSEKATKLRISFLLWPRAMREGRRPMILDDNGQAILGSMAFIKSRFAWDYTRVLASAFADCDYARSDRARSYKARSTLCYPRNCIILPRSKRVPSSLPLTYSRLIKSLCIL